MKFSYYFIQFIILVTINYIFYFTYGPYYGRSNSYKLFWMTIVILCIISMVGFYLYSSLSNRNDKK